MADDWRLALENKVKDYLVDSGACHDFFHAIRVRDYSFKIAEKMKNVDEDILFASALLHDIGYKNSDPSNHDKKGMEIAKKWLSEIGFPFGKISKTLEVIRLHDNFSFNKDYEPTKSSETLIVQDADRVEALGVIGFTRTAYFFGENKLKIYDTETSKNNTRMNRTLLEQIEHEQLKNWKNFNFNETKKMTLYRQKVLLDLYNELKDELEGKK